ncbi:MAG TPA: HDOD domain-containing protein [Chitinispirillaceae bacterium]|nr:HDOD domain-containing protein [Chitinispirillaceae bacterium]
MSNESILQKLELIEKLPTLPAVVNQITQLIQSNRSNMAQIASVIMRDQAIASRVIRLVNSAYYGLKTRVTSIQQAITLLGLNSVRNIVTGVAIVKTFEEENGSVSTFDRQKFWLSTFCCALLSKNIAQYRGAGNVEDYFLGGLLHDVGILVLDQFFHDEFNNVINGCLQCGDQYFEVENRILGTNHCEIGDYLAKRWKLPDILANCMRAHHQPLFAVKDPDTNIDLLFTVHIADAFTQKVGFNIGIQCALPQPSQVAMHKLELNETVINQLAETSSKMTSSVMREWGIQG